jgi:hypothetical protein
MWHEINRLFAVRDNHNDRGTPLWNTEVGVSSDPTEGVGPEQGTQLIRLYRSIEGHPIKSFIIYRFHDCATVPCAAFANPYFNHTGVVEQSLTPKPAYCELGAAIGDACDPPGPPDPPDNEAPETTIDSGPQGKTTNASPSFTFSSEPNATFECRLDSGSWSSCTSPKSYLNLAAGTHVFEVRATDQAGNIDPTPAARSFKVTSRTGGKGSGG